MQCLYTTGTHHGIDDTVVGYEDARRQRITVYCGSIALLLGVVCYWLCVGLMGMDMVDMTVAVFSLLDVDTNAGDDHLDSS